MIKILNKDLSKEQMDMLKKIATDNEFTIEDAAAICLGTFCMNLFIRYRKRP